MTTELKRMRQLIGAPADWAANDLVIGAGEVAVEAHSDDHRIKIGDGAKRYSELPFASLGLADATDPTKGDAMVAVKQPFPGAVPRTQHDKNAEQVSVKDFGATADGITNDAGAFNAAIASLLPAGGIVVVPAGRYKISGTISMKSNVTVRCDDGAVLDGTGDTGNFISFIGTVGAEFLFNTSPTRGGTTVGITGAAFAVGDIVHLVSYNSVFAPGEYNLGFHPSDACWFTEWNIIAQVVSAGVYRLAAPFEFPGWTSGVAKAKKVTPITNSHWIGGTIIRPTSGADSILESDWAYQCSVRDTTIYHGRQAGGSVTWRKSWLCEGRNVTNHNDPTFLYDYSLHHGDMNRFKTTGSQDCGFVGVRDSFSGQSVDFTYSGTNAPYSNVRSYCEDGIFRRCFEGLTSHPGCYKEEWIDNTISDCYDDGLVIRGYMATVHGNVITSTYNETGYTLTITAPNLIASRQYDILTVGTTDFTLCGAPSNTVGTRFSATGPGIGTGTVTAASTVGVVLNYVGARRADVGNNRVSGFYSAFRMRASASLGYFNSIYCNFHDNDISKCVFGIDTMTLGNTGENRFITFQNNKLSLMGRYVAYFEPYTAGVTIKGNVLDGDFAYMAGSVAFVMAEDNCPGYTVVGNVWNRTRDGNPGQSKRFVNIGGVTDLVTFPEATWGCQTFVSDNIANWEVDTNFLYTSISSTGFRQYGDSTYAVVASTIAAGVATCVPNAARAYSVKLGTEGSAATDDLDRLIGHTNCVIREGDLVYLRLTAGSSQDVTIRDVTTTAAATHGFQLPGNASITLGSSSDTATFLFNGTTWSLVSFSANG